MVVELPDNWTELSDNARVWIWSSSRKLSSEDQNLLENRLGEFVSRWTSHQVSLKARACVILDHFVIIALDESASTSASGCSIDALTHAIVEVGRNIDVDLQDRLTFFFYKEGDIMPIHMNEVKSAVETQSINTDTLAADTLVKSKKDLMHAFLKPASSSWHARFL